MKIRRYAPDDTDEIINLFYNTVHTVNACDYTSEQLEAWAPRNMDSAEWHASLKRHFAIVVTDGKKIIGFGDIDANGYLDRLYVHAEYTSRGVGTAICRELESFARGDIITHASVTAKPVFERMGYVAVKEQSVMRRGVYLKNYVMKKKRK